MNSSILSSLTKSSETPKPSVENRQSTQQNTDFDDLFTNTVLKSEVSIAVTDTAENAETIDSNTQDDGEILTSENDLITGDSIQSKPQTNLAAEAAMIPTHDSGGVTHQLDPKHEGGSGLTRTDAPDLKAKTVDPDVPDDTVGKQAHLNDTAAGMQITVKEAALKPVETLHEQVALKPGGDTEKPSVPSTQNTAGAQVGMPASKTDATDQLVIESASKSGGALQGNQNTKTREPTAFPGPSIADRSTRELAADASDSAAAPPDVKRGTSQPMSTLERHLGGHAVSLIAQAKSDQAPNRSIPEAIRRENPLPHVSDALPLQNTVANVVQANVRNPLVQAAGASFTIAGLHHNDDKATSTKDSIGDDIIWETRTPLQTSGTVNPTNAPKADLAGTVIQQIADAIRRSPDRPIEIALSPVELGRVRMVLSASDAGITVNILAERSETLDLMRRNIDDLGKSFSDIGYEDISFSFQQGDQTADDRQSDQSEKSAFGTDEVSSTDLTLTPTQEVARLAIAPDGIDMRL